MFCLVSYFILRIILFWTYAISAHIYIHTASIGFYATQLPAILPVTDRIVMLK
jgi:hypothetical protein